MRLPVSTLPTRERRHDAHGPAPVYLDHAATTPVDPDVVAAMVRHLDADGVFANPSATAHGPGRAARDAVERARREVALTVGARPDEVLWTSGATESNNLALKGVTAMERPAHVITAASEHASVLEVCEALARTGVEVTRVPPNADGRLDPAAVASAMRPDTAVVSVMHVNNETGVVQDIALIARAVHAGGALLHVDGAQSVGKLPVDVARLGADLMSCSAHKVYGPKGVGALVVRRHARRRLVPLLHGGGQEGGLRGGTLATHQVVGMGEAFRLARERLDDDSARARALRGRLWRALEPLGALLNGSLDGSVGAVLNVSFAGVSGDDLVAEVDGVALSSGSACGSARGEPSHVLRAMGASDERADGSIRLSLGRSTTERDVDFAARAIGAAVARLRRELGA